MKLRIIIVLFALILTSGFSTEIPLTVSKIEVIKNDVPFVTEKFTRIGYTLKMWEFKKEGLRLEKIVVFDYDKKTDLLTVERKDFPPIFSEPLSESKMIKFDKIDGYYISIQLPIPIGMELPTNVCQRLCLKDTVNNKNVTEEGGLFSPRKNDKPLVINSPVKGEYWLFLNQSTLMYHFFTLFFVDGKIGCGERYASDLIKINDKEELYSGDAKVNEDYFCYGDTLYAVADAVVHHTADGRPENRGDAHDVKFNTLDEYAGNYIILNIGNGNYAVYAHCIPGSIKVKEGDIIKEGDPIALLGNSGNSTSAHLHFSINDGPDFIYSNGLPFVLKQFTKTKDGFDSTFTGTLKCINSMMEENSVVKF